MTEIPIFIFAVIWTAFALLGFKRPGLHAVLVTAFLVAEQIFAFRLPSVYLSNRKFFDILTGVIVLLGVFWNRRFSYKGVPKTVWFSFILLTYAGISTSWGPNTEKGDQIFWELVPLTLLATFLAPMCLRERSDVSDFLYGLLVIGAPMMLVYSLGEKFGRSLALQSDFGKLELQPLAVAQLAGYLCVIAAIFFVGSRNLFIKAVLALYVMLCLYVIANTSSRGQLLAVFPVLAMVLPVAFQSRHRFAKMFFGVVISVLVALAAYWIVVQFELTSRWDERSIESGTSFRSSAISTLIDAYAREGIFTYLFGLGSSASYSIMNAYCHNVAVEVLCELGIFGLALYCYQVFFAFKNGLAVANETNSSMSRIYIAAFLGIAFFDLILSQKQGAVLSGYTFAQLNLLAFACVASRQVNADYFTAAIERMFLIPREDKENGL